MATNNDEKILTLKQQISDKRIALSKVERFNAKTNLVLMLDETTYNLNVLPVNKLQELAIKVNMYRLSANDLEITDVALSNYAIQDWLDDILGKIAQRNLTAEKSKLATMEARLEQLLSEDKRVEIELANLEKSLGL